MAFQRRTKGSFSGGFKGKSKFGEGKSSFGGPSRGRSFSSDRRDPPTLYPATCSDCGSRCEVPFRPNGKKPVLCKSCFDQTKGSESMSSPKRYDHDHNDRNERPSNAGNENVGSQLRAMNMKLDSIIKMLTSDDLAL